MGLAPFTRHAQFALNALGVGAVAGSPSRGRKMLLKSVCVLKRACALPRLSAGGAGGGTVMCARLGARVNERCPGSAAPPLRRPARQMRGAPAHSVIECLLLTLMSLLVYLQAASHGSPREFGPGASYPQPARARGGWRMCSRDGERGTLNLQAFATDISSVQLHRFESGP